MSNPFRYPKGAMSFPCNTEADLARARLMLAAPALLAACEAHERAINHVLNCVECERGACRQGWLLSDEGRRLLVAALAAARGRGEEAGDGE